MQARFSSIKLLPFLMAMFVITSSNISADEASEMTGFGTKLTADDYRNIDRLIAKHCTPLNDKISILQTQISQITTLLQEMSNSNPELIKQRILNLDGRITQKQSEQKEIFNKIKAQVPNYSVIEAKAVLELKSPTDFDLIKRMFSDLGLGTADDFVQKERVVSSRIRKSSNYLDVVKAAKADPKLGGTFSTDWKGAEAKYLIPEAAIRKLHETAQNPQKYAQFINETEAQIKEDTDFIAKFDGVKLIAKSIAQFMTMQEAVDALVKEKASYEAILQNTKGATAPIEKPAIR